MLLIYKNRLLEYSFYSWLSDPEMVCLQAWLVWSSLQHTAATWMFKPFFHFCANLFKVNKLSRTLDRSMWCSGVKLTHVGGKCFQCGPVIAACLIMDIETIDMKRSHTCLLFLATTEVPLTYLLLTYHYTINRSFELNSLMFLDVWLHQ